MVGFGRDKKDDNFDDAKDGKNSEEMTWYSLKWVIGIVLIIIFIFSINIF